MGRPTPGRSLVVGSGPSYEGRASAEDADSDCNAIGKIVLSPDSINPSSWR